MRELDDCALFVLPYLQRVINGWWQQTMEVADSDSCLQSNLDRLSSWAEATDLCINLTQSQYIHVNRSQLPCYHCNPAENLALIGGNVVNGSQFLSPQVDADANPGAKCDPENFRLPPTSEKPFSSMDFPFNSRRRQI